MARVETLGRSSCHDVVVVHRVSPPAPGPYTSTGVPSHHGSHSYSLNAEPTSLIVDLKTYPNQMANRERAIILTRKPNLHTSLFTGNNRKPGAEGLSNQYFH